jgi:hypothetical protein
MSAKSVPLRGKLEEHSFSDLMRSLLRERRDGCLSVARGAVTRRIYLRDGMIIYGSSNDPADRLGEILTIQGKLSKADHKKYWEESLAGNRLLGITLLVNGKITLHDLYQAVTAQVVTIFDRLQKWRKGDYEFIEGSEPAAGAVLLRIPLALYLKADGGGRTSRAARPRAGAKKKASAAKAREREPDQEPARPGRAPEPEPASVVAEAPPEQVVIVDEAAEPEEIGRAHV